MFSILLIPSIYSILPSIERCLLLVQQYQVMPDHRRRLEGLAQEAVAYVPSAIRALRETSDFPGVAIELRRPMERLINAWEDYAQAVGVAEATTAIPLRLSAFRTCALRTCLCNGEKPAHKMRVCVSCWQVFYCGKKCQTE